MEPKKNRLRYQPIVIRRSVRLLTGTNAALTPLINVVFLLLIFFMISSSLVFQPGITVNLPETKQEFKSVADKLIITITKEKLLFFNDQRLEDWIHLDQRLSDIAHNHRHGTNGDDGIVRTPIIILKADRDVPYKDIVKVMSITRRYGFGVFLVTKSEAA